MQGSQPGCAHLGKLLSHLGTIVRLGVVDDPSCEDATTKVTAQGHEAFLAAASGFGCCSQGALKVTLAGDPPV